MNYIRHLTAFYGKLTTDGRLTPCHVSLYFALFQFWNLNHFINPVSISREQILLLCKIGSNHTYYRVLKDLSNWGYIQYEPSFSPVKGSLINLCIFAPDAPGIVSNNEHEQCKNDIGSCAEMHQERCKNDIATCAKMHPSINNININNKTYREELTQNKKQILNSEKMETSKTITSNSKRKKVAPKKVEDENRNPDSFGKKTFQKPNLDEVIVFFKSENHPEVEAQKFFNHFESNGWKVGGKTPMKNWQAAARNWMLNSQRFIAPQGFPKPQQKPKPLPNNKNYSEPL